MNPDGPLSWKATRQRKGERSEEDRAYSARVTKNKRKASARKRAQRAAAARAEARKRNAAPLR